MPLPVRSHWRPLLPSTNSEVLHGRTTDVVAAVVVVAVAVSGKEVGRIIIRAIAETTPINSTEVEGEEEEGISSNSNAVSTIP